MRMSASERNATWLILPVVICLSQRLSHACVSTDAAERMEISLRGAEKIFKKLRDAGIISRQGSRKSGSWVINK